MPEDAVAGPATNAETRPVIGTGPSSRARSDHTQGVQPNIRSHCIMDPRHKGKSLKRKGLSKFYSSKSQSFTSLELALATSFGESAKALAKQPCSMDLVPSEAHSGHDEGKGKDAKAKPAPLPGRWLDRDCNAALNMQRNGESRWRPLKLCWWPEQGKLPAKGKEYPGLGYKRVRDKPPKTQPAVAQ
ncbi:hypothetical protein QJQ45_012013 [Haematococcus lacustris]|nr:hypothetical protein QJQ45_012013 [Haematococcus lacustris]